MMRLDCDWHDTLRRAWSVRFIGLSFLCDVIGIVLAVRGFAGVHESPATSMAWQIGGAAFTLAAFVSRLVYQRGLSKGAA